ncbi:hypothetical protein ABT390_25525 [Streptomyces aurantiacus]|uniref:Putative Mucin-2 n=1 Tax=Streptomyces aurantiacus JA 4570 TaxID=1286094 RepID=S3ZAR6_9ACTN|nr:hypothetical protein [Streptomyces aurantiacus]EPH40203.1 putative Mucin-2 [Streptomyces aurantiacus JA 4570]
MGELVDAAVGFPGVAFSSALAVVVCFWLLVAVGAVRVDSFDEDADLGTVGLGGVPVSVAVSLLTGTGWAVSIGGTVAVARTDWTGLAHAAGDVGLLALSALVAWGVTRALARPLAWAFRDRSSPAPGDLVGSVGTVHTGWVDAEWGRAEVATGAGGVAVVEVRRDPLARGARPTMGGGVVLYAYDEAGAFFWAAPCAAAFAPGGRVTPAAATPDGPAAEPRRTTPDPPPAAAPADDNWPQADCA